MFYRYEVYLGRKEGWNGITSIFNPDHSQWMSRFLTSPKWYDSHPDIDSKCWFTQYGYDKYHKEMEEIIEDCKELYDEHPLKIRLLKADNLENIVCSYKVQCIQLTTPKEKVA